jgi:hypothetical protein
MVSVTIFKLAGLVLAIDQNQFSLSRIPQYAMNRASWPVQLAALETSGGLPILAETT